MGRRILACLLAMALIFALPVFSLADVGDLILKDSGSPEVSLMAMRSIAANQGISIAAAEGDSGTFGYNFEPYSADFVPTLGAVTSTLFNYGVVLNLPAGSYGFNIGFNAPFTRLRIMDMSDSSILYNFSVVASELSETFTIDSPKQLYILGTFRLSDISTDAISVSDFGLSRLKPVEGISCGWSVNDAFSESIRRDSTKTFTWDFGNQPSGNYILNAYHYGIAYDVDWNICYGSSVVGTDSRFIPVSNSDGVSTALVSHGGGDLILSGTVTFSHPYGAGFFDGSGSYNEYNGSGTFFVDIFQPDSWAYAVTDVVIIPLESAGLEQFGIFGSIVGFFRDEFASLKSFLTDKFNKDEDAYTGATSPELSQDINSASSIIEQEEQFTDNINIQITEQSSKVDPVTVLDGISGSADILNSMLWVSNIVSSTFDNLGVFQFLIYIPIILGIVNLVIGRGASFSSFSIPVHRRSKTTGLVPYDSNTGMRKGGS